jgi:hypothetical protein
VRRHPENAKLLFCPYTPLPLQKGDRTTCLYRDALVVVTSWSDGRISWPRCRAIGHRGGSGLLIDEELVIDEELARAICSESAAAVEYWWGVANSTVTLWQTALGVKGWTGTEGTRRLMQAGQERRVAKLRGRPLPPEQVQRRRPTARAQNPGQSLNSTRGDGWTKAELRLLGTLPDAAVAARTGRGANAVRVKRCKLGIPNPSGPGWTAEELELLGTAPDAEVAARIGRTEGAVTLKRCRLGIPTFCDRRRENRSGPQR